MVIRELAGRREMSSYRSREVFLLYLLHSGSVIPWHHLLCYHNSFLWKWEMLGKFSSLAYRYYEAGHFSQRAYLQSLGFIAPSIHIPQQFRWKAYLIPMSVSFFYIRNITIKLPCEDIRMELTLSDELQKHIHGKSVEENSVISNRVMERSLLQGTI